MFIIAKKTQTFIIIFYSYKMNYNKIEKSFKK